MAASSGRYINTVLMRSSQWSSWLRGLRGITSSMIGTSSGPGFDGRAIGSPQVFYGNSIMVNQKKVNH